MANLLDYLEEPAVVVQETNLSHLVMLAGLDEQLTHMKREVKRLEEERKRVISRIQRENLTDDGTYVFVDKTVMVRRFDNDGVKRFREEYPDVFEEIATIQVGEAEKRVGKEGIVGFTHEVETHRYSATVPMERAVTIVHLKAGEVP